MHVYKAENIYIYIFPLQLRGLLDGTNLVFAAVLLQHALVVVLPESLGRVLAGEALQDLGAAGMLVEELWRLMRIS